MPPLGGPLDPCELPPAAAAAPGEGEPAGARPEIVDDAGPLRAGGEPGETVEHPARVMRIASMIKRLLEEVRQRGLPPGGDERMPRTRLPGYL